MANNTCIHYTYTVYILRQLRQHMNLLYPDGMFNYFNLFIHWENIYSFHMNNFTKSAPAVMCKLWLI